MPSQAGGAGRSPNFRRLIVVAYRGGKWVLIEERSHELPSDPSRSLKRRFPDAVLACGGSNTLSSLVVLDSACTSYCPTAMVS